MNEEIIVRLAGLEERAKQIDQNIQIIEENILDLERLKFGLDELQDSKGREIFASVGRGVFVKSKIESNEFLVDVGGKNFVKKSVEDVKEMLDDNINKLKEIKQELFNNLNDLNQELENALESTNNLEENKED